MSTLSHISHTSSHFSHISDNGGTLQQGRFFWMQCAIDEPVLRGCVNLSTVPMSTVMADQLDWIDMVIDAEAYEKFGDPRTCVIVGSESHDTYSVLVMATFGSRPISAIDRLTAFYAFSVGSTAPWPSPLSPVIETTPSWPRRPCYLLAIPVSVRRDRLLRPFTSGRQSRFLANDLKILESVCAWKEEETLNIPDDEFKAMQADWKNQQEALNRLRQTRLMRKKRTKSAPPGLLPCGAWSSTLQTIAEEPASSRKSAATRTKNGRPKSKGHTKTRDRSTKTGGAMV